MGYTTREEENETIDRKSMMSLLIRLSCRKQRETQAELGSEKLVDRQQDKRM